MSDQVRMHYFVDADGNYRGAWDDDSAHMVPHTFREVDFPPEHASQIWNFDTETYGSVSRSSQIIGQIMKLEREKSDRALIYGEEDSQVIEINTRLQSLRQELISLE
jgi:hypothetical protein